VDGYVAEVSSGFLRSVRTIGIRELGTSEDQLADVRAWAQGQMKGLDADSRADAVLVLDELVSNALRHGVAPGRVRLTRDDGHLRVEVTDASDVPARPRAPDRTGGRGLVLVAACSRRWGQWWHEDGKTVWAEVPVSAGVG
jgi:anti-sigma regulatory factor (Ser/Thr protein kinase)